MRRVVALLSVTALVVVALGCTPEAATSATHGTGGPNGQFVGRVAAVWLDDGRTMELLEDFQYLSSSAKAWDAPKGSTVNGASIPRLLWSLIGSPFTGPYRHASVVHDVACDRKSETWAQVHRMFYDACLCGGTEPVLAKTMYGAVYHYGPRWDADGRAFTPRAPEQQFTELERFIEEQNPTLDEIEHYFDGGAR